MKSTGMMKKVEEREKKKMDEMKKKLHTDDESKFLKNFQNYLIYVTVQFLEKTKYHKPYKTFHIIPINCFVNFLR